MSEYSDAMAYIAELDRFGMVLGLDNMRKLLSQLGNPEKKLKIIHIAGTNGKGSVGAFIGAVLTEEGYKVGRYVSPTIFCYEERFQINGKNISKADLVKYIKIVKNAAKHIVQPTVFEVETAIALCYFAECDYVLLEVGLGGRLDATNAVDKTLCSVITSVSYDHTNILGNTLAEIAFEKAGIIKPDGGVVVTLGNQPKEAFDVIKAQAKQQNADFRTTDLVTINADGSFNYREYKNLKINLAGNYQYTNACLAIEVLNCLNLIKNEDSLRQGLLNAVWYGRFQVIKKQGQPTFIFDGAHNPHGVSALIDSLKGYENIVYICGIFADKDYSEMVKIASKYGERVFTITPPSPRALACEDLKQEFLKYKDDVIATSLNDAITQAFLYNGGDCSVVVFGSLSFLGDAIKLVKEKQNG